jgi:branched-chain amino acid transport system substrate-binding protein
MKKTLLAATAALALAAGSAGAQELRIGFLNTTTGGGALIGRHLENGWKLGLAHEGWTKDGEKIGGVATKIFYADDQAKPDVGVQEVDKFLKQHKTQIVAGIIWSNVMMAVTKPIFDAKSMLLINNAGAVPLAGPLCSPLFVSTSFVNDQNAEATGELATRDKVETVVSMAPNYQAGKDNVEGFARTYKGKVLDTIYFKVGETDYQADLAKVRALKPKALYIFAPGAMGVAFMKQWAASGLGKEIRLYTLYAVDEVTLPGIGDAGIGTIETGHYNPDLKNPENDKFRKDYIAKYGHKPSYFAVQGYDGPRALAIGLRATGGKIDDMQAVARAIRTGSIKSPRGTLTWNKNGFLIQPYYKLEIVKGADGKPTVAGREVIFNRADSYVEKCPADRRT